MNDELIAALERAALEVAEHDPDVYDAIRAHIETLRATGAAGDRNGDRVARVYAAEAGFEAGHAAGMAEATAQIVAYALKREEEWRAKEADYRSKGNHGPYLGEPRWREFASAIEAGAHLKGEG